MKHLKYIKRLFESINYIDPINIEGMKITLINPDGRQVTVEMEEDGEWEEWIESPYIKAVSVSGDDGTYVYTTSAIGDDYSGYEIDKSDNIEFESIESIKDRSDAKRKERDIILSKSKLDYQHDLKKSNLSKSDYDKEEFLKRQLNSDYLDTLQRGIGESDYAIAMVLKKEYDSETGKLDYSHIRKYKIPIPEYIDLDSEGYLDAMDLLGIEFNPEDSLKSVGIINKKEKYMGLESPKKYKELDTRNYLDRAPFYADITFYISDL